VIGRLVGDTARRLLLWPGSCVGGVLVGAGGGGIGADLPGDPARRVRAGLRLGDDLEYTNRFLNDLGT